MHFSSSDDPAITCFSFSPSTDTDGTDATFATFSKCICANFILLVQHLLSSSTYNVFVLNSNQIDYTYDVKLESLADYWEGWDLTVEVTRIRRICEFQLQLICLVFIPSPQLQLRFYENKAIYEFSKHSSPIFTSHFYVCHARDILPCSHFMMLSIMILSTYKPFTFWLQQTHGNVKIGQEFWRQIFAILPSWNQFKSLVVNKFQVANKQWINILGAHPRHL